MIKKTSSNQLCGRDSEYLIGAFIKSFSILLLKLLFYIISKGRLQSVLFSALNKYVFYFSCRQKNIQNSRLCICQARS